MRLHRNSRSFLLHEAIGNERLKRCCCKQSGGIGTEAPANSAEVDMMVAHQPLDHMAPESVVAGEAVAARDRQSAFGDAPLILGNAHFVLDESLRQATDRRGAQPDQDLGVVGSVSLEVAAEAPGRGSLSQRVVRQREMVEADLDIAGARQRLGDCPRLGQARFSSRQGVGINLALVRLECRYMRVTKNGEAVRP